MQQIAIHENALRRFLQSEATLLYTSFVAFKSLFLFGISISVIHLLRDDGLGISGNSSIGTDGIARSLSYELEGKVESELADDARDVPCEPSSDDVLDRVLVLGGGRTPKSKFEDKGGNDPDTLRRL